jgi:hypothetical protein
MMNQMIEAKRRAMIKGKVRMMAIKEKHYHIQECVKIFKEITPSTTSKSNFCEYYSFIYSFEPLKVEDALRDPDWMVAM